MYIYIKAYNLAMFECDQRTVELKAVHINRNGERKDISNQSFDLNHRNGPVDVVDTSLW